MKKIVVLVLFSLYYAAPVFAQDESEADNIRIVESKNYVFKAQNALPQRGRMVPLTPEYDLIVTGDSVIAFLPYFGRAFSAPIGNTEGGIKFTSTEFDYKASRKAKRKRWDITIIPKDANDIARLTLTLFENGSASLQVSSINRTPITFNGYFVEGKPRNKKAF